MAEEKKAATKNAEELAKEALAAAEAPVEEGNFLYLKLKDPTVIQFDTETQTTWTGTKIRKTPWTAFVGSALGKTLVQATPEEVKTFKAAK